ncbi:MAG: hypothetical protein ABIO70_24895, partial [Pseudomonadota bacterium]
MRTQLTTLFLAAAFLTTPAEAGKLTPEERAERAQRLAAALATGMELTAQGAATYQQILEAAQATRELQQTPPPSAYGPTPYPSAPTTYAPAPAPSRTPSFPSASSVGTMLVRFANYTGRAVQAQVFSQDRPGHTWPSADKAWSVSSHGTEQVISCQIGEKVCYGAWLASDPSSYWGAGFDGDSPCTDCCARCGSG